MFADSRAFRKYWELHYPNFRYLHPEGSLIPSHKDPIYSINSNFSDTIGRDVRGTITSFALSHQYPSSKGPYISSLFARELGAFKTSAISRRILGRLDIQLHTPSEMLQANSRFTDAHRHTQGGIRDPDFPITAWPRITFINANRNSRLTETDFNPSRNTLDVASLWAHACSLRFLMGISTPALGHIFWDVGLFSPSIHDSEAGFDGSRSLSRRLQEFRSEPEYVTRSGRIMRFASPWGIMLLARPLLNEKHLFASLAVQGYRIPINPRDVQGSVVAMHIRDYFKQTLFRIESHLQNFWERYALTLSPTGVRLLDSSDIPADYEDVEGSDGLEYPLGIEITLPVGARIPDRITRETRMRIDMPEYHPDNMRYERVFTPIALLDTTGPNTAWMADQVERDLADQGLRTLHRVFRVDSNGEYKIKLFLIDYGYQQGYNDPLYDPGNRHFRDFDKIIHRSHYNLLGFHRDNGPPHVMGVVHPREAFWPILFPVTYTDRWRNRPEFMGRGADDQTEFQI